MDIHSRNVLAIIIVFKMPVAVYVCPLFLPVSRANGDGGVVKMSLYRIVELLCLPLSLSLPECHVSLLSQSSLPPPLSSVALHLQVLLDSHECTWT